MTDLAFVGPMLFGPSSSGDTLVPLDPHTGQRAADPVHLEATDLSGIFFTRAPDVPSVVSAD